MTAMTAANPIHGFAPLAPLLHAVGLFKLDEALLRVRKLDREDLLQRHSAAFTERKRGLVNASRVLAYVLSEELTRRGIAPWMRHHHLSSTDYSINQRFDLFMQDIRFLRREYPSHVNVLRYRRCKGLFTGTESAFHSELTYCFYDGSRAAWKIVKTLGLTDEQQLCCMFLRSAPIAKRLDTVKAMRGKVSQRLHDDLQTTRRTTAFTHADAKATLIRRHRLWLCRAYTIGGPAKIAKTYEQLTGTQIDRKVVARQLQIITDVLRRKT